MELYLVHMVLACCWISSVSAQRESFELLVHPSEDYPLPDLPFAYEDLEPFLDTPTLRVHHLGHHRAYTDKMNAALRQWREHEPDSKLAHSSIFTILSQISQVPEQWRTALRNNGGGYVNHIFYWNSMCSAEGIVSHQPIGRLADDITKTFGSFEAFKKEFDTAGSKLFGSGYVWLVENREGALSIITTQNQDCPLSDDLYPLLVMDVWEHAYYLKHQNKRSEYISDWWNVVCWEQVDELQHFWWHLGGTNTNKHTEL